MRANSCGGDRTEALTLPCTPVAANQNYTVETQLDNGVRMLQVQGHMNGNDLHLCHT